MTLLPTLEMLRDLHTQALLAGGPDGIRDEGAIDGALNGIKTKIAYEDTRPDMAAIELAWRLSKAHGFVDGNKRTSALAFHLTLAMNGWIYTGSAQDLATEIINGAASKNGLPQSLISFAETTCRRNPVTQLLMDYDQGKWP